MVSNNGYYESEIEFDSQLIHNSKDNSQDLEEVRRRNGNPEQKTYNYDEAIDLTGPGWYNIGALAMAIMAVTAMTIEMYGFSFIVSACSCEFKLDLNQKSILLTVPFIGPMLMAYPWGYISDTQGRKRCLLIGSICSFIPSVISAFSVNWIMLMVLKFFSTSFCSCAQSITYTWLGESCSNRIKGQYMLMTSSFVMLGLSQCVVAGYFILPLEFSYSLGTIKFTSWRLFAVILALPSGVNAVCLLFYYESPKFVLKTGREEDALKILQHIYERNGGKGVYSVNKVVLDEAGNVDSDDSSFLKSLRIQTVPIFKPPYIWRTLQLYLLMAILLGCTTGLYIWFPFIAMAFYEGLNNQNATSVTAQGLCNVIANSHNNNSKSCVSTLDIKMIWIFLAQGISFFMINFIIVSLSSRKKAVSMAINAACGFSCLGILFVSDTYNISSFIFYFGVLLNGIGIGIIYMFCVDIYPTSYRGMASSLALLVGRISSLIGINVTGTSILNHCTETFYTITALFVIGFMLTCFLPPDRPKKT